MKKLLLVLVAMFPILCFSQNIIQVTGNSSNNSNEQSQEECPFRINGICSTEDIGGVDVSFVQDDHYDVYISLKNYNNSNVTVLIQYYIDDYGKTCTENLVVLANGRKKHKCGTQTYLSRYILKGIIVRKIS